MTHMAGAAAFLLGSIVLILLSWGQTTKMVSLAVFGASLVFLFAVSAVFHGVKLPEEKRMWLNRLDHAAIFLLIAGTYTPIATTLFPKDWRIAMLAIIWGAALAGIAYKIISPRIHGLFNTGLYLVLSWAAAIPAIILSWNEPLFSRGGFLLILAGGLIYTAGFFIYFRKKPNPLPNIFGHHEIWHLFVLAGSLCHFLFMLNDVVPHPAGT